MWVEAVLAVPDGTAAPDGLAAALTAAARARRVGRARAMRPQPVPEPTTMLALRDLWQDATR